MMPRYDPAASMFSEGVLACVIFISWEVALLEGQMGVNLHAARRSSARCQMMISLSAVFKLDRFVALHSPQQRPGYLSLSSVYI